MLVLVKLHILRIFFILVIDSWGKLPSGVLAGHLTDLGNFDQCLEIGSKSKQTQYCISKFPKATSNSSFFEPVLRLGICFPRACSVENINEILKESLKLNKNVVEKCSTDEKKAFSTIDWTAM